MQTAQLAESIADRISERGFAQVERFLDNPARAALAAAVRAHPMRAARTGVDHREARREAIRGDVIAWIDPDVAAPAIARWHAGMQTLGVALAQALRLPPLTFDAHLTRYPPGTFYRSHVDAADEGSRRLLSAICYLGEGWTPTHGGRLRIARAPGAASSAEDAIVLPPLGGSLVLFTSHGTAHEVEETSVERLSLTGWYLRAPDR